MKITKSNALEFAQRCLKQAESISSLVKQSLAVDKKTGKVRNYKNDFAEIDQLKSLALRAMKLLDKPLPGYSFAEQTDSTITKFQIRDSVLTVAKQIKNISAFLLKKIESETKQLIDKDYSALLKKLESTMKVINAEIKLYKDESTWLFAESKINHSKNESVRYQIGWKVPLLGRLVDALELQIKKENEENATIDHTKLLIKIAGSLNSFDEDLKLYRSDSNAPVIQSNKLLNKLTGSSFSAVDSSYSIATISVDECGNFFSETEDKKINSIPDDRAEFHKIILAVQKRENVSYAEALNICRYGKK